MNNRKEVLKYFEQSKDFFENIIYPNIEKYRKGSIKLSFKDEKGNPILCESIKIKQISHEFKFGANLFMLDELETDEKNQAYKDYFKNVFNMATLPFYWNSLEEEKGQLRYDKNSYKFYRRPPIDLCMEFCEKNGIEPREHALAYEHHFPAWLKDSSIEEIKSALEVRYKQIADRYAKRIPTIEVTNEMLWGHNDCVTPFYNDPSYINWCFEKAEKYFPHNQLVVNEYTDAFWGDNCRTTDRYYAYTEAAILKGARIDAIGAQYHIFESREREMEKSSYLYNPRELYNHMDMYSNLVNALQVTEITIPAYSNNKEDEEIQAELIKYLYTVWFSHPAMEQIVYWNLVDGYAYVANPTPEKIRNSQGNMSLGENVFYGGLLNFDLTPKPAYRMLDNLINKVWSTEICDEIAESEYEFRGFYGKYEIEVQVNGETKKAIFDLSKYKSDNINLIF